MRRKLRDARGETLVEVLCAILIGALSVAMLFSMVMVSVNMNRGAKAADEKLAADLGNAEARASDAADPSAVPTNAGVTVTNKDPASTAPAAKPPVKFYGGDNAISYALPTPTPTPVTPP